jgi:hypothetical protein
MEETIALYVCQKCYKVVGCEKDGEPVACLRCALYVSKPCSYYRNASKVLLDCVCPNCQEVEKALLN